MDVNRYRMGMLEFVREKLGRENILTNAHVLDVDSKGVRFQLASGLPQTLEVGRAILYFWTPRMERRLIQNLEKYDPRAMPLLNEAVKRQQWEEWQFVSRYPVNPAVVGHLESVRVWADGEGIPHASGLNSVKVMRRVRGQLFLGEASFQDISKLLFQFLGWDRCTVRHMQPRTLYRWNHNHPIEFDSDGIRSIIISSCDGPLHWIASQVRSTIDGI